MFCIFAPEPANLLPPTRFPFVRLSLDVGSLLSGYVLEHQCVLQVYTLAQRELLPTPTKSHYTFNLRDVSKVFQVRLERRSCSFSASYDGISSS